MGAGGGGGGGELMSKYRRRWCCVVRLECKARNVRWGKQCAAILVFLGLVPRLTAGLINRELPVPPKKY